MSGESERALGRLRARLDEAESAQAELVERARRDAETRVRELGRAVEDAERELEGLRDRVGWASDIEAPGGSTPAQRHAVLVADVAPAEVASAPPSAPRATRGRARRRALLVAALAAAALGAALALGWRP